MNSMVLAAAVPKCDYTNPNHLDRDARWENATEAKAVVQVLNKLADGTQTQRTVASELFERGDDMTDAEFKDAVFYHAQELKELYEVLAE